MTGEQPQTESRPTTAAGWDARLRSPTATDEDRAAFRHWRAASPQNGAAFDTLQAAIGTLRRAAADHPELRSLRERTLVETRRSRKTFWLAAAAAMPVILALGGYLWLREPPGQFATVKGERSTLSLEDGSTVELNTHSRIHVALSPAGRVVTLLEGQALFDVAPDPRRPFVVVAGDRRITALGTAFDVRLAPGDVTVTTLEGRVAVEAVSTAPGVARQRTELVAGQQLSSRATVREALPSVADIEAATSWRRGQLIFRDTPLALAVEEINRYVEPEIVVADAELGALRINGMFRTGQTAGFLGAIAGYYPVESRRGDDGRIHLEWRAAGAP
jgi:transmembrane sensor